MVDEPAVTVLSEMTWQEAAQKLSQRPVGLLPIGAIEAHGPHLPLDADVIIATATARHAALRLEHGGIPAVVLPAVAYGVSFVGACFAGTSPVDPDAFERYLGSLLSHAARQGYRAIVCCNAHLEPAHVEQVQAACRQVEAELGLPIRAPDQRDARFAALLSEEFRAGARHAGAYETSIVLASRPDAVRAQELSGLEPVWIDLPSRLRAGARTFAEAGAQLGYFGNPAASSVEEGHRLLDALAEIVVVTCREVGIDVGAVG